jgi:hypothetical protein
VAQPELDTGTGAGVDADFGIGMPGGSQPPL